MSKSFKAPDGTEFTTRNEMRDYLMLNYYSFKDKHDIRSPLIKIPGSIDGQPFEIASCSNCTLVVLDHCAQVQIDDCRDCRILIGACSSSIFIRNSTNCSFYVCGKQIRVREVTKSTFYIYSFAEVHIELSKKLNFAPFNGGYPEQTKHFIDAQLDPHHNLWYDIYDHNDQEAKRLNWALLDPNDYESPWFPADPCDPLVKITKPGSVSTDSSSAQVGQSFGLNQMIADSNTGQKAPQKSTEPTARAIDKLKIETAMLIVTAEAKSIIPARFLSGDESEGRPVSVADFSDKIVNLGLLVGVSEDEETKRDLEAGTSKTAVNIVASLFSITSDEFDGQAIDVAMFLKACRAKVDKHLEEMEAEEEANQPIVEGDFIFQTSASATVDASTSSFLPVRSSAHDSPTSLLVSATSMSLSPLERETEALQAEARSYISGAKKWAAEGIRRPGPADAGQWSGQSLGETDPPPTTAAAAAAAEALVSASEDHELLRPHQRLSARTSVGTPSKRNAMYDDAVSLDEMEDADEYGNDYEDEGDEGGEGGEPYNGAKPTRDSRGSSGVRQVTEESKPLTGPEDFDAGLEGQFIQEFFYSLLGTGSEGKRGLVRKESLVTAALHCEEEDILWLCIALKVPEDAQAIGATRHLLCQVFSVIEDDTSGLVTFADFKEFILQSRRMVEAEEAEEAAATAARSAAESLSRRGRWGNEHVVEGDADVDNDEDGYDPEDGMLQNYDEIFLNASSHQSMNPRSRSEAQKLTRPSSAPTRLRQSQQEQQEQQMRQDIFTSPSKLRSGSPTQARGRSSPGVSTAASAAMTSMQAAREAADRAFAGGTRGQHVVTEQMREKQRLMQLAEMLEVVEDQVRNTVRQTDLYHFIQVHLGFIEAYTMVPARGQIVASHPREWLSIRDLQTAFLAGRLRLNDAHVYILMRLVKSFAVKVIEDYDKKISSSRAGAGAGAGAGSGSGSGARTGKGGGRGLGPAVDRDDGEDMHTINAFVDSMFDGTTKSEMLQWVYEDCEPAEVAKVVVALCLPETSPDNAAEALVRIVNEIDKDLSETLDPDELKSYLWALRSSNKLKSEQSLQGSWGEPSEGRPPSTGRSLPPGAVSSSEALDTSRSDDGNSDGRMERKQSHVKAPARVSTPRSSAMRLSSGGKVDRSDGKPWMEHAVIRQGKLSADWLKRYLIHLRLSRRVFVAARAVASPTRTTNKRATVASAAAPLQFGESRQSREWGIDGRRRGSVGSTHTGAVSGSGSGGSGGGGSGGGGSVSVSVGRSSSVGRYGSSRYGRASTAGLHSVNVPSEPVEWEDWLVQKSLDGRKKLASKPKDFRRALAGQKHALSQEEMNNMLDRLEIVPQEIMQAEIEFRVQHWVLDVSGRRDFSHSLNVEIRKWQKEKKKDWEKLPATSRAELTAQFKKKIINDMVQELQSAERTSASITKDLYWKFDAQCKQSNYSMPMTWGEWLKEYLRKTQDHLQSYKKDSQAREKLVAAKTARSRYVAAFTELESQVNAAAKGLPTQHSIELRKTLVALKKSACVDASSRYAVGGGASAGVSAGVGAVVSGRKKRVTRMGARSTTALVSKHEFDKYFENVLASKGKAALDPESVFRADPAEAVSRVLELEGARGSDTAKEFELWKQKKKAQKLMQELEEKRKQEERAKAELKREKEAAKAYKKWLKSRNQNKYISKIDGKDKSLPVPSKVAHSTRWNGDPDMRTYYDDMERRF